MDTPVVDPGNGGFPVTVDVAALITAVTLPRVEPFGPDSPVLAGLPAYCPCPVPDPEPASRVSVARTVQASAVAGLAAVRVLEARTAALKAALITLHLNAVKVEATALALDGWQTGVAESAARAEIAVTLQIPEGTATLLAGQAVELVDAHPETLAALETGVLSWRHACTIIEETRTLAETPTTAPSDVAAFEARLLSVAPGTTGGGFASWARRMREGTHPETLTTRTRQAISKRYLSVEPGKDGMAWLSLHIPQLAADAILVHCTRQARTQQGPTEHRTLTQLRADAATLALLGQQQPGQPGATPGTTEPDTTGSPGRVTSRVGGLIRGLAGAVCGGLVDGIVEDPVSDYLEQLEAVRAGKAVTEPPLPTAQVIITVPVLGLLGATNEPALLAGGGPIPESTARKLLYTAGTFLRVLTDPATGTPLPDTAPQRYRLREAEKTFLRALNETCSFPNCTNPVMDTETDHLTAYNQGGPTTAENSQPVCRRHHTYKHFRDDKDRHGHYRQDRDPERAHIRLRGWKPTTTADGRVGWTSPTGNYHRPKQRTTTTPTYPKWIKKRSTKTKAPNPDAACNPHTTARKNPHPDLHHSPLENLINYTIDHHRHDNN